MHVKSVAAGPNAPTYQWTQWPVTCSRNRHSVGSSRRAMKEYHDAPRGLPRCFRDVCFRTHLMTAVAAGGCRTRRAPTDRATSSNSAAIEVLRIAEGVAGPVTARASGPPAVIISARSTISCRAAPISNKHHRLYQSYDSYQSYEWYHGHTARDPVAV
jgi:hypothetical protein